MSDHSRHDLDLISEHLDGRLSEPLQREVLERLRECAECRDAHASLVWARDQARKLAGAEAPGGLEGLVRGRLRRRHQLPAWAAAAALVVGLALILSRLGAPPPISLPEAVAADVRSRAAGELALAIDAPDVGRLEAFFAEQRLGFETRVLDLGMMGFVLRGGNATPLSGHPSALMVYRETATGLEVFCRMLRERLAALPAPDEIREHDGIRFQVYHLDEVTVVFWPEGEVLCALAWRGDREALVQLAFAKAMKASLRTEG